MESIITTQYEILEKIGAGAFGSVYLARHKNLNIKVVLKKETLTRKINEALMRREVDILKTLKNPYIPIVYDYIVEKDTAYTVMEYIEGESLEEFIKRGQPIQLPQIVRWAIQILTALKYLHSPIHGDPPHGYIHSDIKPANIMVRPNGDISLIDFNVSFAIGEQSTIGLTRGYASPEHYGICYSEKGIQTHLVETESARGAETKDTWEEFKGSSTVTESDTESDSSSKRKRIVPDERSDLYSVGALLYHLISGKKPAANVLEVIPLSPQQYNSQVVAIIQKAMSADPRLRYQSAEEMLQAFLNLKKNDSRSKALKRSSVIVAVTTAVLIAAGITCTFIGLRRMQKKEEWLKLTEYSIDAYADGDIEGALRYALDACPQERNILTPSIRKQTQLALTQALEVYNLSDGFRVDRITKLPSEPLFADVSPDGKSAACLCLGQLIIVDTGTSEVVMTLEAENSALAEVRFVDSDTFLFAGIDGLTAYDLKDKKELWKGEKATGIAISGDGKTAAGIYKDSKECYVYDIQTGKVIHRIDLDERYQPAVVNNIGFNPRDNMFVLNEDGSKLGISLDKGTVKIYDLKDESQNIEIIDDSSRFGHFEGGFYEDLFLFAGSDTERAEIVVINLKERDIVFNRADFGLFHVVTEKDGIWVSRDNRIMNYNSETNDLEQYYSTYNQIKGFAKYGERIIAVTDSEIITLDEEGNVLSSSNRNVSTDIMAVSDETLLLGNYNSTIVRFLKYKDMGDTVCAVYDPSFPHLETRISEDGKHLLLSTERDFAIYRSDGLREKHKVLPDSDQIYDQQYIREGGSSLFEITYYNGTVDTYDGITGDLVGSEKKAAPDKSLQETLETEHYRIENKIHQKPVIYSRGSGKQIALIEEDAYLTYADEAEEYLVLRFITTDLTQYGCLMDKNGGILARLPYLCDVHDGKLYFDYQDGAVRETQVFSLEELLELAQN